MTVRHCAAAQSRWKFLLQAAQCCTLYSTMHLSQSPPPSSLPPLENMVAASNMPDHQNTGSISWMLCIHPLGSERIRVSFEALKVPKEGGLRASADSPPPMTNKTIWRPWRPDVGKRRTDSPPESSMPMFSTRGRPVNRSTISHD